MAPVRNPNRSFPPPRAPWTLQQTWRDILFAHWRLPAAPLPLLPPGLELDTHEGSSWISIVAFRVSHAGPRFVPPLPWVSSFNEVNLRTYVRFEDRPGVYFHSLDASQPLFVRLARAGAGLAYFDADVSITRSSGAIECTSRRKEDRAHFVARYRPLQGYSRPAAGTLMSWLVDRYCSFSVRGGALFREEIHHGPWRLEPTELEIHENTLFASAGLEVEGPPDLVHYAREQRARFWLPTRASQERRRAA